MDSSPSTEDQAEWDEGMTKVAKRACAREPYRRHPNLVRTGPLRVKLVADPVEDFVWTLYGELMGQTHVVDLLRDEAVTGFEASAVESRWKNRDKDWEPGDSNSGLSPSEIAEAGPPPRLWEIGITGWGGLAHADAGIVLKEVCESCGSMLYYGLKDASKLIDTGQWDGSDVFFVWPFPGIIFVTDRVKQLCERYGFTGVTFTPPSEFVLVGTGDIAPGRLDMYMSDELARERARVLGINS